MFSNSVHATRQAFSEEGHNSRSSSIELKPRFNIQHHILPHTRPANRSSYKHLIPNPLTYTTSSTLLLAKQNPGVTHSLQLHLTPAQSKLPSFALHLALGHIILPASWPEERMDSIHFIWREDGSAMLWGSGGGGWDEEEVERNSNNQKEKEE